MKKFFDKIRMWWYFHIVNPVVRKGESKDGAFKWEFRRFWLEISTLSGNFKARYMADEHPYAYLLAGKSDDNIVGFCQFVYMLSKTVTSDAGLVNDVRKAFDKYEKRMEKSVEKDAKREDEVEEKVALETEKAIQEHVELPEKDRKREEERIDKKFKKAVKSLEK